MIRIVYTVLDPNMLFHLTSFLIVNYVRPSFLSLILLIPLLQGRSLYLSCVVSSPWRSLYLTVIRHTCVAFDCSQRRQLSRHPRHRQPLDRLDVHESPKKRNWAKLPLHFLNFSRAVEPYYYWVGRKIHYEEQSIEYIIIGMQDFKNNASLESK